MDSRFIQRGGLWVVAQNLLSLAVLVLGPASGSSPPGPLRTACLLPGILLIIAGAVLGIAGVQTLGANRTPFPQPLPESRLVVAGIYRRVRHPLYSSLIALGFGWSLVWGSIPAGAAAALLFLVLLAKARIEESALEKRYPDYAEYRRQTPRFFPALRIRRSAHESIPPFQ